MRRGKLGVRTVVDVAPAPEEALDLLMQGHLELLCVKSSQVVRSLGHPLADDFHMSNLVIGAKLLKTIHFSSIFPGPVILIHA